MMMKVAIIITVYEEVGDVPSCYEECQKQTDALSADEKYSFSVFMNSDGEHGMGLAWKQASKEDFDFYIFMDSDLRLSENAIGSFLENSEFLRHRAVIAGTISRNGEIAYGGRTRRGRLIEPDPVIPVPCHLFDMNLVMIPKWAFSHLDDPYDLFSRHLLDYAYGKCLVRKGVSRVVAPGIMAETGRKTEIPDWKNPDNSLWKKLRSLNVELFRKFMRALRA